MLDGLYIFALLSVFFIPFPFHMFPSLHLGDLVFGRLIVFIAEHLPGLVMTDSKISSDSTSMYLLLAILLTIALILSILLSKWLVWQQNRSKVQPLLRRLFAYYLSLQLLKYGFDKIFKGQFYLPEPNILYTPLGQVDKDLLFWSTLGTSYLYSFITGLVEVLAAVFIMFRKTRILGLLIAVPLLLHILLLNFSFDISVKLFTAFLLLLSLLLLSPQLKRIYGFIVSQDMESLRREGDTFAAFNHPFVRISLKTFIIGLIFLEALYPAFRNGHFNDDLAARPYLHGAYEVLEVRTNEGLIRMERWPFRRFFVHRDGYMIFQDWRDQMVDYKLAFDKTNRMNLTRYDKKNLDIDYKWNAINKTFELQFSDDEDDRYSIKARSLDWKNMPALRPQFHWMVDEVGR
jgi:hypothetical protein